MRKSLELTGDESGDPVGKTDKTLVVLSGDLVNKPGDRKEWEAFFGACDRVRKDRDFELVSPTGNHGNCGGYEKVPGYKERFLLTGNGPFGHENGFFSFDRGCAHFIVFDSNYMDNIEKEAAEYLGAWIKYDLACNGQPAVFAVMHNPMCSASIAFDDVERAKALQDGYLRLLKKYGVDFILCGHEHLYSRTNAEFPITQIMGVSGEKHYHAGARCKFARIHENVAITTVFDIDTDKIRMESFDRFGNQIDRYEKIIQSKLPRNCGNCLHCNDCDGTGAFEKEKLERRSKEFGKSPLIPAAKHGIIVDKTTFCREELDKLDQQDHAFSVMREGRLREEVLHGFELQDILDGNIASLTVVRENGFRYRYNYSDLMHAKRFVIDNAGNVVREIPAPPIIFMDEEDDSSCLSKYRLAIGQQRPGQYNGRLWAGNIVKIEVQYEIS